MSTDYDLIVLGGGPGGMAAAKEAARLGKRVALFDFVRPSARGATWGVGGTCVNVGCIPKKLMHYAAGQRVAQWDRHAYGLDSSPEAPPVNWQKLVKTVQNHLKMLNFSYRSGLTTAGVTYLNAFARLKGAGRVEYNDRDGNKKELTAPAVIIAVGERPFVPSDVAGAAELAITSDDVFSLARPPGRTLVVGGSYVALECAGFLGGLGFPVDVAVRSVLLRGFDRQCAAKVGELLEAGGVGILQKLPSEIRKEGDELRVTFGDGSVAAYDTVMYATGRVPLEDVAGRPHTPPDYKSIGIELDSRNNIVAPREATSLPGVFAVGDVVAGVPKLAPVAIKAGELLARRLFAGSAEQVMRVHAQMDYSCVPSCVYTPFEYACVGLSEEDAVARHGADGIDVFLKEYASLEVSAAHRVTAAQGRRRQRADDLPPTCLAKAVCLRDGTILGLHFVGPNAGEIMQGLAALVRLRAKKADLDATLGIHPTDAESFVNLTVTRASGESWVASGGCAGGRCG